MSSSSSSDSSPASVLSAGSDKQSSSTFYYELIASGTIRDPVSGHKRPPYVPKKIWTELGKRISLAEHTLLSECLPHQTYTLRLDITKMSSLKKLLMRRGVFAHKWSAGFATLMQEVTVELAKKYNALYAYTQSDEITLVIAPPQEHSASTTPIATTSASSSSSSTMSPSTQPQRGTFQHIRGGKWAKLVSLSAAFASALATAKLARLPCSSPKSPVETSSVASSSSSASSESNVTIASNSAVATKAEESLPILIEFDCRMAVWNTPQDAFQVILWRAYDASVNGVTDACFKAPGFTKKLMGSNTSQKLEWLQEKQLLPLPRHQAYGTLYKRSQRLHIGTDPRTQTQVECTRSGIEEVSEETNPRIPIVFAEQV